MVPYCAVAAVLAALLPVATFFISRASAKLQECPAVVRSRVSVPFCAWWLPDNAMLRPVL